MWHSSFTYFCSLIAKMKLPLLFRIVETTGTAVRTWMGTGTVQVVTWALSSTNTIEKNQEQQQEISEKCIYSRKSKYFIIFSINVHLIISVLSILYAYLMNIECNYLICNKYSDTVPGYC